jgi:poly-gamma-glutamate capsule biosynthesis protein CapA/YwtB (metallophosphatase superfamily)
VKIFLCGDVMTGRGIDQVLPRPCDPRLHESHVQSAADYVWLAERANGPIPRGVDFAYVWGAALDEWRRVNPDLRVVNLETSITRSNAFVPKGINYRMSPDNAPCLAAAAPDLCVLANNHVLDWGRAGLLDTLAALRGLGIRTAGAGRDAAEAAAPAVFEVAGGRVLVLAFSTGESGTPDDWAAGTDVAGVNLLAGWPALSNANVAAIGDELAPSRRADDVVIVSIHWGSNWGYPIPRDHRRFAHALIDRAGVSVVHGHSSHHAKAIEVYRDRLILYGCGDFLNDYEGIKGYESFRDDLAVMYFAEIGQGGALEALELVPLQIRRFQLVRAMRQDARWLAEVLDRESRPFGARVAIGPEGRLTVGWEKRA